MVGAHLGNQWPMEAVEAMMECENIWYDMSGGTIRHYPTSWFRWLFGRVDRNQTHQEPRIDLNVIGKLMFGSDNPDDTMEFYRNFMETASETYGVLRDALGGSGEAANQDARYVLPNAVETKIMVTMNARELFHFLGERLCMRAQWEIRRMGQHVLTMLYAIAPDVFAEHWRVYQSLFVSDE